VFAVGHLDAVSVCAILALVLQSAALIFFAGALWRNVQEHQRRLDSHGGLIQQLTQILFEIKGKTEAL
jgi:hypothetical protein